MSIQAYQRAATQAESPRQLEYRAFGLATAGLIQARDAGRGDLGAFAQALDRNRQLWSLLASDCMLPDNKLADALRAQIISLSLWVNRYTSDVLRNGADVEPLIEVNRSIMEGLAAG